MLQIIKVATLPFELYLFKHFKKLHLLEKYQNAHLQAEFAFKLVNVASKDHTFPTKIVYFKNNLLKVLMPTSHYRNSLDLGNV